MKIKSVRLRNFKRFTDLTIQDIPRSAKLVVVVGPNGCGKSSLFEAFNQWYRDGAGFGTTRDIKYFNKEPTLPFAVNDSVSIETHDDSSPRKGSLYMRTSYRNDPDFNIGAIQRMGKASDEHRIGRVIDNDQTVSQNYQRLVYQSTTAVYDNANDNKTVLQLREELIGSIRKSMKRVFSDLLLNSISAPLEDGTFYFEKGTTKKYHYKNLSGGEKAAFDLLLDFHLKRKAFEDAVYCIDEVETHLHTAVQGKLLQELVDTLPEQSQLWVTTHSLGVLRTAQELYHADPGSACAIDFSSINPDEESSLSPASLGRTAMEKVLSIAIDDLALQIVPKTVFICEGSPLGSRRKDFDASVYVTIFCKHESDCVFVSGGNADQVNKLSVAASGIVRSIAPSCKVVPICDRDDRTQTEIGDYQRSGGRVLGRRNIESYLLDESVISKLCLQVNSEDKIPDVLSERAKALESSQARGNAEDDLKSAAGEIYVALKKTLSLTQCGNNSDAFMRDTMAPLITPDMEVYRELRESLFGAIQQTSIDQ